MNASLIFLCLATVFGVAGYVAYVKDIVHDTVAPNRWSWLIWSFALLMEASTYQAVNQDWVASAIFFIGVALCIGTTLLIWKRAKWETPHWTEVCAVIVSSIALVLWLKLGSALWAYWLMVAIVPVSFIPTWRSAVAHPDHERSQAWVLWVVCDIATLLLILSRVAGTEELLLAVVDLVVHLSVLVLVRRRL